MMGSISVGDLTQGFRTARQTSELKRALLRLTSEVTTGRTADVAKTMRGDFRALESIENSIAALDVHQISLAETRVFADAAQQSLGVVQEHLQSTGTNLISLIGTADSTVVNALVADARESLSAVISALNATAGGRTIFSGVATDRSPIADTDIIMGELVTATSTATSANDVITAIDAWFETPGGGFETVGYLGSTTALAPFDLGLGDQVRFDLTAQDAEIRDVLKGFATAAILQDGTFNLGPDDRRELLETAGERLLTVDKSIAEYRAHPGTIQGRLDDAELRNTAEMHALEIARSGLLGVDQYEAAGELEMVQVQLEMIYTLTARMQRLNLMEFLR